MVQSEIPETPVNGGKISRCNSDQWEQGVFEYQDTILKQLSCLMEWKKKNWLHRHVPTRNCICQRTILKIFPNIRMMNFMLSAMPRMRIYSDVWKQEKLYSGENELFGYEEDFNHISDRKNKRLWLCHNFRIEDNDLGAGGPKANIKANIEAIRLLQTLEKKNVWQHQKNRKYYPIMLAGAVSRRHLKK